MTKRLEIHKCAICGNIVEVLHEGAGELACCKAPMKLLLENTVDASREKHVPVIERSASGVRVSIGSIPHPMEEKHYIEWIALSADGQVLRQFLKPGDKPSAWFGGVTAATLAAREHCNLHGLWKT
ncbi:MAG: desulfoferrodoxin [Lentisphaerae bacterium]|nr:desulfoferrodoxin [Lentisphaerota bacterium]